MQMVTINNKVAQRALKWLVVVVLVTLCVTIVFGEEFQNYIGKTPAQLSGFSSGDNTITDPDYWYDQVYAPIAATVQRINKYRYAEDYSSNIQAAVDSGGCVTFTSKILLI